MSQHVNNFRHFGHAVVAFIRTKKRLDDRHTALPAALPVSSVVANLFMENLESKALDSAAQLGIAPRLWKRYVDDVFSLSKRQNVDAFLQHLNDQDGNIRFTTEAEVEHGLPFLDVAVTRRDSGRLMTGGH